MGDHLARARPERGSGTGELGTIFVQLAGIGFDAQAVAGVDRQAKKNFGPLSYVISAAKVAARRPPQLRHRARGRRPGARRLVRAGRQRTVLRWQAVAVFKQAVIDDGKLDVLVFKNLGYLDIIRYIQNAFMGTHLKHCATWNISRRPA